MKHISLKKLLRLTPTLVVVSMGANAHTNETTLCHPREDVYFSCPTENNKIISLCAFENSSPNHGYVQYRFGTPDHIEFEFPNKPQPPKNRVLISDISVSLRKIEFTHIKFKSVRYDYVIYTGYSSGIYVLKNGKSISNRSCDSVGYQQLHPEAYLGIKTVPPVKGID